MTWAPCPHGVRTRGKKDLQLLAAHTGSEAYPVEARR